MEHPRGLLLGPSFFNLFYDLSQSLTNSKTILFADYATICWWFTKIMTMNKHWNNFFLNLWFFKKKIYDKSEIQHIFPWLSLGNVSLAFIWHMISRFPCFPDMMVRHCWLQICRTKILPFQRTIGYYFWEAWLLYLQIKYDIYTNKTYFVDETRNVEFSHCFNELQGVYLGQ